MAKRRFFKHYSLFCLPNNSALSKHGGQRKKDRRLRENISVIWRRQPPVSHEWEWLQWYRTTSTNRQYFQRKGELEEAICDDAAHAFRSHHAVFGRIMALKCQCSNPLFAMNRSPHMAERLPRCSQLMILKGGDILKLAHMGPMQSQGYL